MLFAILFGLSMDYNVFLLSRIHEAYNEGDGPRESVIHGMARIGKVILFAGLIMAAVFLAFVTAARRDREDVRPRPRPGDPDRRADRPLVIAPAVVTLLGDHAWWLPGWLDRDPAERLAREGPAAPAAMPADPEREKVAV